MSNTAHTPGWLKHFQAKTDFFELIKQQAEYTGTGINGLHEWFKNGAPGECQSVHECEHKADDQKKSIEKNLSDNFVTPFDREDIYDISERLDLIINGAKTLVQDMEFFNAQEVDEHLLEMSDILVTGMALVTKSIEHLNSDLQESVRCADEARRTESHMNKAFRKAMKELYDQDDLKRLTRKKQLYDYMGAIATRTERVAEKLLHVSIKSG